MKQLLYTLKGNCILTELNILAKEQKCNLNISEIYHIPSEEVFDDNSPKVLINRPFF